MTNAIASRTRQNEARRHLVECIDAVTRRKRGLCILRTGRQVAASATAHVWLDVRGGWHRRLPRLVFQRPSLLRAVYLPQILDARRALRFRARVHEVRNRDCRQQPDDGHHNHDLDESKPFNPFE